MNKTANKQRGTEHLSPAFLEAAERKYSIYVVERNYGTMMHSFLALVDETDNVEIGPNEFPKIIEQVHFNDNVFDVMQAELVLGAREDHKKHHVDFHFFPYIGGNESVMLPMWDHILAWSQDIIKSPLQFQRGVDSPYAINCRAGVRSAIRTIGLEFYEEYTMKDVGAQAHEPSAGKAFLPYRGDSDLKTVRRHHQALVAAYK